MAQFDDWYTTTSYTTKMLPKLEQSVGQVPKTKRSFFAKFINFLQGGQYITASRTNEAVKIAKEKGVLSLLKPHPIRMGKATISALRAGSPFGSGYKEGEMSYSDVLTTSGWEPTTKGGKFAKGAIGLAGDILLDPTTYITGGVGGVIKGTGTKVATKATFKAGTKAARKASFRTVEKYTEEMARAAIKSNKAKAGIKNYIPKVEEVDNLVRRMNKLKGIANRDASLRVSTRFLPFDKAWKEANKTFIVADSKAVREFGDKTIAPYFNALMDYTKKGKLGEAFYTSNKLYKIVESNPTLASKVFMFDDYTKGLNLNKIEKDNLVKAFVKDNLSKFTQKEQTLITNYLEGIVKKQNKIKKIPSLEHTTFGKKFKSILEEELSNLKKINNNKKNVPVDASTVASKVEPKNVFKEIPTPSKPWNVTDVSKGINKETMLQKLVRHKIIDADEYKVLVKKAKDLKMPDSYYYNEGVLEALRDSKAIHWSYYKKLVREYNEATVQKTGIANVADYKTKDYSDILFEQERKTDKFIKADDLRRTESEGKGFTYDGFGTPGFDFEDISGAKNLKDESLKELYDKQTKRINTIKTNMVTKQNELDKIINVHQKKYNEYEKLYNQVKKESTQKKYRALMQNEKNKIFELVQEHEHWEHRMRQNIRYLERQRDTKLTVPKPEPKVNSSDIPTPVKKYYGEKQAQEKAETVSEIVTHHGKKSDGFDSIIKEKEEITKDLLSDKESINKRLERIAEIENALKSEEAFESLAIKTYGSEFVYETKKIVKTMFDESIPETDRINKIIEELTEKFNKMIKMEKDVGIVFKGEDIKEYVHHLLTDSADLELQHITKGKKGKALAKALGLSETIPGFAKRRYYTKGRILKPNTKDYDTLYNIISKHTNKENVEEVLNGFYSFFNENLSRDNFSKLMMKYTNNKALIEELKEFSMHLPQLKNGSVAEINEIMKSYYGLKSDLFVHNISDIYLARALKHNEAVYDKLFTDKMLNMFGDSELTSGKPIVTTIYELRHGMSHVKDKQAFLKSLGMEDFVYDFSQPFIKLTRKQANRIFELNKLRRKNRKKIIRLSTIDDIMFEKAGQLNKVQQTVNINVINKMLNKFDRVQNIWKTMTTVLLPGFHIRNKYSNSFQMYLGFGTEALSPKINKEAYKVLRSVLKEEPITGEFVTEAGKKISYKQLWDDAIAYGAIDGGWWKKDIDLVGTGALEKLGIHKADPTNIKDFTPYVVGRKVGSATENFDRFITYLLGIKKGMSPMEATEYVNKYLFDYGDLTNFEIVAMKRLFPFYTWMRKNIPLQIEEMAYNPKRYMFIPKLTAAIESSVDEEDKVPYEERAEFAKDWIQLPGYELNKYGQQQPRFFSTNLPYTDFDRLSLKEIASMTSPLLKTPFELAVNRHLYFDIPIDEGYKVDSPGWIPGHTKMNPKLKHVLDQITALKQYGELRSKKGDDKKRHVLNLLGGIKIASYNQKSYRRRMIKKYQAQYN